MAIYTETVEANACTSRDYELWGLKSVWAFLECMLGVL